LDIVEGLCWVAFILFERDENESKFLAVLRIVKGVETERRSREKSHAQEPVQNSTFI
jgi:trehalose-6-phosphate synthase